MHTMLRSSGVRWLLLHEGPGFCVAMIIAEQFFKFGSFSLECLAFLGTWYASSRVFQAVARLGAKMITGR